MGPGISLFILAALVEPQPSTGAEPSTSARIICFKYSTLQLLEGERIVDGAGDMEDMYLTIRGPIGDYRVSEGGWAPPTEPTQLVASTGNTSVYRVRGQVPRYAVFGPRREAGEQEMLIWLSGPALKGSAADAQIYSRLEVRDPSTVECAETYAYSLWQTWKLRIKS
jgi:hypothetical protein